MYWAWKYGSQQNFELRVLVNAQPLVSMSRDDLHSAYLTLDTEWSRQRAMVTSDKTRNVCALTTAAFWHAQSYPGYPNTFVQRGFIGCSDNPNETFPAIYILHNINICTKVASEGLYTSHCTWWRTAVCLHWTCTLLSRRVCDFRENTIF